METIIIQVSQSAPLYTLFGFKLLPFLFVSRKESGGRKAFKAREKILITLDVNTRLETPRAGVFGRLRILHVFSFLVLLLELKLTNWWIIEYDELTFSVWKKNNWKDYHRHERKDWT